MSTESEIEMSSLEDIDDSIQEMEDQNARWIVQELVERLTDYIAIDVPDDQDQEVTEREDEPLNSEEHVGETSSGIGSDCHSQGPLLSSSSRLPSIFRVPQHIRGNDEKFFTPRLVSIGPFHHKNPSFAVMEAHKWRFLNKIVGNNKPYLLETIRKAMTKIEPKARRYYSESFPDLSTEDFVEMMVLDGCFIVQLFRLVDKIRKGERPIHEPIFSNRWMFPSIGGDLLMLENQLPFTVLEKLHKLTSSPEETTSFDKLALQFLILFRLGGNRIGCIENFRIEGSKKHLLALFQSFYAPRGSRTKSAQSQANRRRTNQIHMNLDLHSKGKKWVNNAATLKSRGITFLTNTSGELLDIGFKGRCVILPTLAIHEDNAIIMKNLLAYEQCDADALPYMTSLILFLSSLAVVPDDVEVLRRAGILQHQPGNNEMVIDLLKLLCREIECDINEFVLFDQARSINRYRPCWYHRYFKYKDSLIERVIFGALGAAIVFWLEHLSR